MKALAVVPTMTAMSSLSEELSHVEPHAIGLCPSTEPVQVPL